ncbi:MAG: LemA family protein [Synergistaceae bacterium]|nr:LemA family protein [Synergistaceae bacterium]
MMTATSTLVVIAVIAVIILLWGIKIYNGLVQLSKLKDEAWSGVDVQLRRRFDLVPNLIETVKDRAAHEQDALRRVAEARDAISRAQTQGARIDAENELTSTLRSLFATAAAHPELKSDENFGQLQGELSALENDLQLARRYYNGTVMDFNNAIQTFPSALVSHGLGFRKAPLYSADEGPNEPVQAKF